MKQLVLAATMAALPLCATAQDDALVEFQSLRPMLAMELAVATMQDLFFDIDVLDEELGIISGKKWFNHESTWADHPTYYLYETDELLIFNTNFRSWGPFNYRKDLTRMTITVRPKEKTRLLVRASVQYNIRAVEDPEMYQKFFKTLGQSLFLDAEME